QTRVRGDDGDGENRRSHDRGSAPRVRGDRLLATPRDGPKTRRISIEQRGGGNKGRGEPACSSPLNRRSLSAQPDETSGGSRGHFDGRPDSVGVACSRRAGPGGGGDGGGEGWARRHGVEGREVEPKERVRAKQGLDPGEDQLEVLTRTLQVFLLGARV